MRFIRTLYIFVFFVMLDDTFIFEEDGPIMMIVLKEEYFLMKYAFIDFKGVDIIGIECLVVGLKRAVMI